MKPYRIVITVNVRTSGRRQAGTVKTLLMHAVKGVLGLRGGGNTQAVSAEVIDG